MTILNSLPSARPLLAYARSQSLHRLAGHPVAPGHVDHGGTVEDLAHRAVTLPHRPRHHDGGRTSCGPADAYNHSEEGGDRRVVGPAQAGECRAVTGPTVARVPEPCPKNSSQLR